jgi:hypothetical protein
VDDAAAVGVEEHDFFAGLNGGGIGMKGSHGAELTSGLAPCKRSGMECEL